MTEKKEMKGILNPADYPEDARDLVLEFNRKYMNKRLRYTISKDDQIRQTTITGATHIYNINVTKGIIEDEFYERIEEQWSPVIESMGLGETCTLKDYVERFSGARILQSDVNIYKEFLDRDRLLAAFQRGELRQTCDYRLIDGHSVMRHSLLLAKEDNGDVIAMNSVMDITEFIESESRLQRAQNTIIKSNGIIDTLTREYHTIWTIDVATHKLQLFRSNGEGTILDAVVMAVSLGDYDEVIENYVSEYVAEKERERVLLQTRFEELNRIVGTGNIYHVDYPRRDTEGVIAYHQMVFAPLDMDENSENGLDTIIWAFRDIDEMVRKSKEHEQLRIRSECDLLTGLYNRGCGEEKTAIAIKEPTNGLLCLLDIDFFKQFNDVYGHGVGDQVLVEVARCLRKTFREQDVVFRLGGDEFAAYAQNVRTRESAEKIINRFFEMLSQIDIPELSKVGITTSVGLVLVPADNTESFAELYKKVDECLYKSKESVGNKMTFYLEEA